MFRTISNPFQHFFEQFPAVPTLKSRGYELPQDGHRAALTEQSRYVLIVPQLSQMVSRRISSAAFGCLDGSIRPSTQIVPVVNFILLKIHAMHYEQREDAL